MFTDSLCDSRLDHQSRRWTTLVSFGLQALAVSALLTLPFLSTQNLPELSFATHLMVPMAQAAVPTRPTQQATNPGTVAGHYVFVAPDHISHGLPKPDEGEIGAPSLPIGHVGPGDPGPVLGAIGEAPLPSLKPIPAVHRLMVSRMMEGSLIYRVEPQYPAIAKLAHIQGAVVLHAVISRDGSIENLQAVSGSPALVPAALSAVRQWRYRPYVLNGEAVEVDTQVTVNFVLAGG